MHESLTLFNTHAEYEAYIKGGGANVIPNISYCKNDNETHYDPIFCRLTLNNNTIINIDGEGALTSSMTQSYSATCTSIKVGELCTSIGGKAFYGFSNASNVDINDSVTTIGASAFTNCSKLIEVKIPSGITKINEYTFGNCSLLTDINISNNITAIGIGAFNNCISLTNISIPSGITTISAYTFNGCSSLTNIEFNGKITQMMRYAVHDCKSLTSVTIPNSITNIDVGCFRGCSKLSSVTVLATTPPTLGTQVFDGNASDRKFYVPSESVEAYKAATSWSVYANYILPIPT